LLLPDTDSGGALDVAEKMRTAIEKIDVPQVDRAVTASLGVASYPTDALDSDTLVRMADRALYAAKGAGRTASRSPGRPAPRSTRPSSRLAASPDATRPQVAPARASVR
jgi:GGDEF domain-containing protein